MIAYYSDDQAISPLYFNTTVYDSFNSSQIINFTVERDGILYLSNESGVAKVFYNPDGDLRNVTIRTNNYLENTTEHNISNNLNATLDYYLARVNFTATDERNSVSLNNFSIETPIDTYNTTTGNIIAFLNRNEINKITFTAEDYASKEFNLTGTDLHSYDISVERSNSIDISIYDYLSNSLINSQQVNLTLTTIGFSQENITSSGDIFIKELPEGDYTLELESAGYEKSTYYFTVEEASYQKIRTYLRSEGSCSNVVFSVIKEDTDPIQDVYLSFQKFINSSWRTILQKKTDFAGQAIACLDNELYRIIATHDDYITKQFELTPIKTEYTLSMEGKGEILYQNSWLTDIMYYTLPDNKNNLSFPATLTFGVSSGSDNIDSFSMQTKYNETIYRAEASSSVGGGEISIIVPIDNSTSNYLEVNYTITNINGQEFTFTQYYTNYRYDDNIWNIENIFEEFEGEDPLEVLLFYSFLILLISGILYYVGFKIMQILISDAFLIGIGTVFGLISIWVASIILFFIIATLAISFRRRF